MHIRVHVKYYCLLLLMYKKKQLPFALLKRFINTSQTNKVTITCMMFVTVRMCVFFLFLTFFKPGNYLLGSRCSA